MRDLAEQRHRASGGGVSDDQIQGQVEGGVLHRPQIALQHGAGEAGQQQQTALANLREPVLFAHGSGPGRGVQQVQSAGSPGPRAML